MLYGLGDSRSFARHLLVAWHALLLHRVAWIIIVIGLVEIELELSVGYHTNNGAAA